MPPCARKLIQKPVWGDSSPHELHHLSVDSVTIYSWETFALWLLLSRSKEALRIIHDFSKVGIVNNLCTSLFIRENKHVFVVANEAWWFHHAGNFSALKDQLMEWRAWGSGPADLISWEMSLTSRSLLVVWTVAVANVKRVVSVEVVIVLWILDWLWSTLIQDFLQRRPELP